MDDSDTLFATLDTIKQRADRVAAWLIGLRLFAFMSLAMCAAIVFGGL